MTAITLGEVTISSLVEIDRSSFPTPSMLPESTAEGVARHFTWLKPHFFDERTGDIGSRIQSFIVRTPEHLVVVDTCVGNDKHREEVPAWHQRQSTWLARTEVTASPPWQADEKRPSLSLPPRSSLRHMRHTPQSSLVGA